MGCFAFEEFGARLAVGLGDPVVDFSRGPFDLGEGVDDCYVGSFEEAAHFFPVVEGGIVIRGLEWICFG